MNASPATLVIDTADGRPAAPVLVSVVIPCFKRPDLIEKAVRSVFAQDFPKQAYELLVVDSTPDESVLAVLTRLAPEATCRFRVFRKKPQGPGPSRNVGAEASAGEWIAFMDSDCQATPGWLQGARLTEAPGDCGVLQGKTGPDPAEPLGVFKYYVVVEQENFIYEACNIFYRREAFEEAGGFSVDLTPTSDVILGGEDVELAWNVKHLGWESGFAAGALVYHEVMPISIWRWIYIKRNHVWPLMTRKFPHLRRFWFAGYFFEPAQFYFSLLLLGVVGMFFSAWLGLLALPYVVFRASESSGTLTGFKRVARPACYLLRDAANFFVLLAGSVRFRSLLL